MKEKDNIIYKESLDFTKQFCVHRRERGVIKNHSRFCLLSIHEIEIE